jgi:hypothetical protein
VYLGYYLANDEQIITSLNNALNQMRITHALLTFITCPNVNEPISLNYSMTNDFFQLSPSLQSLLTDPTNTYVLGVSFGGAFQMISPLQNMFSENAYYGNGIKGIKKLAKDLAWG